MKQQKINVLYAVDLEDNTKTSLLALPSGVRCPKELAEKVVRDFFGEYVCDNDEAMYGLVIQAICNDEQIDYSDWTFFFDEVTMYVPEEEGRSSLDDIVTVTCYGITDRKSRRDALNEYYEGMCCSEGAEHDRYETIFFQLMQGAMTASDQVDFR